MLSVKQGSIKYHFWVFGMTRPGIEPRSPGPLVNTLTLMPIYIYIYIYLERERERERERSVEAMYYCLCVLFFLFSFSLQRIILSQFSWFKDFLRTNKHRDVFVSVFLFFVFCFFWGGVLFCFVFWVFFPCYCSYTDIVVI